MNKRIEALAEMAGWWQPDGLPSDWGKGDYVATQEQIKKFANFLVQTIIDDLTDRIDAEIRSVSTRDTLHKCLDETANAFRSRVDGDRL